MRTYGGGSRSVRGTFYGNATISLLECRCIVDAVALGIGMNSQYELSGEPEVACGRIPDRDWQTAS